MSVLKGEGGKADGDETRKEAKCNVRRVKEVRACACASRLKSLEESEKHSALPHLPGPAGSSAKLARRGLRDDDDPCPLLARLLRRSPPPPPKPKPAGCFGARACAAATMLRRAGREGRRRGVSGPVSAP